MVYRIDDSLDASSRRFTPGMPEKVMDGLFEGRDAVLHVMGWGGGRRGCAETRTRGAPGLTRIPPAIPLARPGVPSWAGPIPLRFGRRGCA
jgi:hypothetical protein